MAVTAASVLGFPEVARAHGIGGRQDLPVPLEFFVVGASIVLIASFVALSILWPEPRLQQPRPSRELMGSSWIRGVFWVGGFLGVLALILVIVAGLLGAPNPTRNPAPVLVFVVFWLVIPFVSGVVGNIYPVFDPWGRLARLAPTESGGRKVSLGYVPAAVAFALFTWLELVAPDAGPLNLAVAAGVYTVYLLGAAWFFGRSAMGKAFDGFSLYNRLFGSMGPFDITRRGVLMRGWLRGLPQVEQRAGLVAMVVLMIGTVTYDGMSGSLWWEETVTTWTRTNLGDALGWSRSFVDVVVGTLSMAVIVAAIWFGYRLACRAAARVGGSGHTTRDVAMRFAHTLVPIAFAYAVAHYLTLIVFEGQLLISTISDPFGRGWDLFGTANRAVDYGILGPNSVWYIQVAVIVLGHIGGVVLAHDRALADFSGRAAVRSQYAMLILMVVLTSIGLTILAAG